MTTEATLTAHKSLVRAFFQHLDSHDIDAACALVADDLVNHAAIPEAQGRSGLRSIMSKLAKAFPDLRHTIHDLIAEGDRVVARMTVRGTSVEPLDFVKAPLPATGKTFESGHMHVFRVADGRLVEHWAERDDLGMLAQLGLVTRPGAPERRPNA
jgi:lactoylglutathione lyase